MTKHTPGPWNHSQESIDPDWWIVTLPGGLIVANVNAHAHQEANARLIAAAPDLLAALQHLAGQINLSALNIRKDFSLINAHAAALKAIHKAESAA